MRAELQYDLVALYRMINGIQEYAWGSRQEIPRLTGIPNPEDKPMAELWMGDHPGRPSRVVSEGKEIELGEFISRHPTNALGPQVQARFGIRLPFLFKLLSAEKGLSIQVHPSRSQAEEGYRRENDNGIPRDAPYRNYKDRNHKPEVLHAVTPFWALSGFREPERIAADFRRIDGGRALAEHLDDRNLEGFYRALMSTQDPRLLSSALAVAREEVRGAPAPLEETGPQAAAHRLAAPGDFGEPKTATGPELSAEAMNRFFWVLELNRQFPKDLGALAPLYLNCIHLAPGEALFLESGLLHAYLRGTGIELMANSDNVLRGGCTVKHVDVPELLRIVRFEPTEDPRFSGDVETFPGGRVTLFDPPVEEFRLIRLELSEEYTFEKGPGPAILFVLEGKVSCLEELSGDAGITVESAPGESLFIPASVERLTIRGPGRAFIATT